MTVKKANVNQKKQSKLILQVMNDLTVQVITNSQHEWLMDTETVAKGYGVSRNTVASHKSRQSAELIENKHWVKGGSVAFCDTIGRLRPDAVLWTKAGVIRLGMFIHSERAKAFRDWAENLILQLTAPQPNLPPANRRKHNRLTPARMLSIMFDVAKIDDKDLRLRLTSKLQGEELPLLGKQLTLDMKGGEL